MIQSGYAICLDTAHAFSSGICKDADQVNKLFK